MNVIIPVTTIRMGANLFCLSVPARKSYSPFQIDQPYGYGENSKMTQGNRESTAQYSEMSRVSDRPTLSERLAPLLISYGLVKGSTLTFGRRLLNLGIQAGVIYAPDGSVVDIPRQDCISWRE